MKKFTIYYLASCSTCSRIIKNLNVNENQAVFREIKSEPIKTRELDHMATLSGSYESLFSKRALKFREQNHHLKQLSEEDYRNLILEEYTFLKRPVFVFENEIYSGNTAGIIEKVKMKLNS